MIESSGMADFAKWKREFRVSLGVEIEKGCAWSKKREDYK